MPLHVQTAPLADSPPTLPRPRDVMGRRHPPALAAVVYREARRHTDIGTAAGRVYLADLAEALCIPPARLRELDRA
ncbi:MAG: hypothetical protein RLO46_01125 [Pseudomonadales bacterium]